MRNITRTLARLLATTLAEKMVASLCFQWFELAVLRILCQPKILRHFTIPRSRSHHCYLSSQHRTEEGPLWTPKTPRLCSHHSCPSNQPKTEVGLPRMPKSNIMSAVKLNCLRHSLSKMTCSWKVAHQNSNQSRFKARSFGSLKYHNLMKDWYREQ